MGFLCSSNSTVENTVETQLPDWITAASQGLIQKATDVANTGYNPYTGPRIADFTQDQLDSFDSIRDMQGYGKDELDSAMAGITSMEKPGEFDSAAAEKYMNPYISNVMDRSRQRTFDAYDQARTGREAKASAAGAFGGDRRFVTEGQAQGQMLDRLADQESQGYARAYDSAAKIFGQDANRALASNKLAIEGAKGIGSLANLGQNMAFQQNAALQGVGAANQGMTQAGYDLAHQDFLNQQNHPYKQMGFYSDILRGTPYGSTQIYSQPAPSPMSSIAGLGIAGLGLYGMGGGFDGGFSMGQMGKNMFGGWGA